MDPKTLEKLNRLALIDEVPKDQIMEMAQHVDCALMADHHQKIQARWRVRILVAGMLEAAQQVEGVEAVVLDFTAVSKGWSLKDSMQAQAAPGYDPAKVAKKFEKATGSLRSRLGFSREVYQSIGLQFSYGRRCAKPGDPEADAWMILARQGERINDQTIGAVMDEVMAKRAKDLKDTLETTTGACGPEKPQPRM